MAAPKGDHGDMDAAATTHEGFARLVVDGMRDLRRSHRITGKRVNKLTQEMQAMRDESVRASEALKRRLVKLEKQVALLLGVPGLIVMCVQVVQLIRSIGGK